MVPALNIAISGLQAAETRMSASASNVANMFSLQTVVDGQPTNQPYVPQQVNTLSLPNGGVLTQTGPVTQPTAVVSDPNNPGQHIQVPNVDVAQEALNQSVASYDFKANLKVIEAQKHMQQSLLDIIT